MKKLAKSSPAQESPPALAELLTRASGQFDHTKPSGCYQFTLGQFPHGWTFRVVNSWQLWHAAGRQTEWGPFPTPEEALSAFLSYVKENRISVAGLQD